METTKDVTSEMVNFSQHYMLRIAPTHGIVGLSHKKCSKWMLRHNIPISASMFRGHQGCVSPLWDVATDDSVQTEVTVAKSTAVSTEGDTIVEHRLHQKQVSIDYGGRSY
ncbi:hypothetical protein NPIL_171981 [Nephila pilipes]|uniref:Uncharacterized protein n=1 Tax=Nephila pilipes TaxID=299642 RepID=A0A8X6TBK6_NEPPI|nr:hypothetical protein NPIL_171981 [Nephila pilipes]